MSARRCGWFGCGMYAEKHVVFAVRVHDAAAGVSDDDAVDPLPNRFDLCLRHVEKVESNYVQVEVRELSLPGH